MSKRNYLLFMIVKSYKIAQNWIPKKREKDPSFFLPKISHSAQNHQSWLLLRSNGKSNGCRPHLPNPLVDIVKGNIPHKSDFNSIPISKFSEIPPFNHEDSIQLTEEDRWWIYAPWKFSIIIKLVGKKLNQQYLKKEAHWSLKIEGEFCIDRSKVPLLYS